MVILYYLPRIIDDITKQKESQMDEYSDQVLHDMKQSFDFEFWIFRKEGTTA